MKGAEWFLYNRTPSYDAILEQLGVIDPLAPSSCHPDDLMNKESGGKDSSKNSVELGEKENERAILKSKGGTDWLMEALPIDIRCKAGSIIMGNRSTPTILVTGFDAVAGSYAAVKVRKLTILDPSNPMQEH